MKRLRQWLRRPTRFGFHLSIVACVVSLLGWVNRDHAGEWLIMALLWLVLDGQRDIREALRPSIVVVQGDRP